MSRKYVVTLKTAPSTTIGYAKGSAVAGGNVVEVQANDAVLLADGGLQFTSGFLGTSLIAMFPAGEWQFFNEKTQ